MKYKVHKLHLNVAKEPEVLENFLNQLKGEVISIIPVVTTFFLFYGAKVRTVVITERVKK